MSIGISTDPFADFKSDNDFLQLTSVTQEGQGSNAQASDEYGDIDCETVYNKPEGRSLTATYDACVPKTTSAINFANVKLGQMVTYDSKKYIITGVDVGKATGSQTEVTINAVGVASTQSEADFNTYDWSDGLTIHNGLGINETNETLGVESGASSSLTSVSISASVTVVTVRNESGELECTQIHAGRVEITSEAISCTEGEPTITAGSGFTEQNEPSINLTNTEYPTSSLTVFKNIKKD